jgi:hypothetical protein
MSNSRSARPGVDERLADRLARAVLRDDLAEARRLAADHVWRQHERGRDPPVPAPGAAGTPAKRP